VAKIVWNVWNTAFNWSDWNGCIDVRYETTPDWVLEDSKRPNLQSLYALARGIDFDVPPVGDFIVLDFDPHNMMVLLDTKSNRPWLLAALHIAQD